MSKSISNPVCDYCKASSKESLLFCRTCKKWFCNGSVGTRKSHILLHQDCTGHQGVKTQDTSVFKGTYLCCCSKEQCSRHNNQNIYDLLYNPETLRMCPVLRCNSICIVKDMVESKQFELKKWKPLVTGNTLDVSLFPPPARSEECPRNLSDEVVRQYEKLQSKKINIDISSVQPPVEKEIHHTKERYNNLEEYSNIYEDILSIEESNQSEKTCMFGDKHVKVNVSTKHNRNKYTVKLEFTLNQSLYPRPVRQWDRVVLTYFSDEDKYGTLNNGNGEHMYSYNEDRFNLADDIIELDEHSEEVVSKSNEIVTCVGRINSMTPIDSKKQYYWVEVEAAPWTSVEDLNKLDNGYYNVVLEDTVLLSKRFDRAVLAVAKKQQRIHYEIFSLIMGKKEMIPNAAEKVVFDTTEIEKEIMNDDNFTRLNPSQQEAVIHALQHRVTLIQGPPGTGKTDTAAVIVRCLTEGYRTGAFTYNEDESDRKSMNSNGSTVHVIHIPILVSTTSNAAADELCKRIARAGVKVLRIMSLSHQQDKKIPEDLLLHKLTEEKMHERYKDEFDELLWRYQNGEEVGEGEWSDYMSYYKECQMEIIEDAECIVTTCFTAGTKCLDHVRFDTVLIDEASQSTDPECFIPISHGAQRLIMVGDHKQLPPMVLSIRARELGLETSLFERFYNMGVNPTLLNKQYRMHPSISDFPNYYFYEYLLKDGISEEQRPMNSKIAYPNKKVPLMFMNVEGREIMDTKGSSYQNMEEAVEVIKIVRMLQKSGVSLKKMSVITSYSGQKSLLLRMLEIAGLERVEVSTVTTFQGKENDYIIFSCVRSNPLNKIGFLNDERRLNVTLTRARYGLFIVGNSKVLERDELWSKLISYYRDADVLINSEDM